MTRAATNPLPTSLVEPTQELAKAVGTKTRTASRYVIYEACHSASPLLATAKGRTCRPAQLRPAINQRDRDGSYAPSLPSVLRLFFSFSFFFFFGAAKRKFVFPVKRHGAERRGQPSLTAKVRWRVCSTGSKGLNKKNWRQRKKMAAKRPRFPSCQFASSLDPTHRVQ